MSYVRFAMVWVGIIVAHFLAFAVEGDSLGDGDVVHRDHERADCLWWKAQKPDAHFESRGLFSSAFWHCENGEYERVACILDVAARMQNRDPDSRSYGNFYWRWGEEKLLDLNAVDFCMKAAPIIWIRHRDKLPEVARETLLETLKLAAIGCRNHAVSSSYTNIALMNALDLILLGQALEDSSLQEEGLLRLDGVCEYTRTYGIHEYCSPTYYGVDMECLQLLQAFCDDPRGHKQVVALLELLSADIALNWWWPGDRLGGAHSREYNFLHGGGNYLPTGGSVFGRPKWVPQESLITLSKERIPRLVRQRWGSGLMDTRTYFVCKDVGLSTAGANHGPMDLPLTVDLPGREDPRCYFIPDARSDPYGTKKIAAGAHHKTHHLCPLWLATQRRGDALGMALYGAHVMGQATEQLASHFVMRRRVDGFWIGDRQVALAEAETAEFAVGMDEPVVLKLGTAAVGVRVPWAVGISDTPAQIALVNDGNDYGAVRLTVSHPGIFKPDDIKSAEDRPRSRPAAAMWVRVGSGLDTDEAFTAWRREFALAAAKADVDDEHIRIEVEGQDGPVVVGTSKPYNKPDAVVPEPTRALLELDGEDVGREIMKRCPRGQS